MADITDGETVEIQGSAAKPYILSNTGGVYSCTCPAWRNQSAGIERRTCKHLRKYRGDQAEIDRIGGALPARPVKSTSDAEGPPVLLAHSWDNSTDLTDWWISEKLDGVRAYWDGTKFLSRQGNEFMAPDWFVAGLPSIPLDGELWMDRKSFQKTISIVRRQDRSEHWKQIRYLIFDAPSQKSAFEDRIGWLQSEFRSTKLPYVQLLEHARCISVEHLRSELVRIESLGGEGLMLRQPGSFYEAGRSSSLLKVKTFHDAEATVIAHQGGKGKHKGRMGALVVRLSDGTEFSLGTGFSDRERENPPAIGTAVTFRYQELTDGGVPRFPSFVRLADTTGNSPRVKAGTVKAGTVKAGTVKAGTVNPATTKARTGKSAPKQSDGNSAKQKSAAASSSATTFSATTRYFEFSDGKSNKFWEITVAGSEVTVRYGRIGADGTSNVKTFSDAAAAEAHASKLTDEKQGKGYLEC